MSNLLQAHAYQKEEEKHGMTIVENTKMLFWQPNVGIGIKVECNMILMFSLLEFIEINMVDIWGKIHEKLFLEDFFKKLCVIAHGITVKGGLMSYIK